MWKNTCQLAQQPLLKSNSNTVKFVRCINNSEIAPRYKRASKIGWWRRKGTRLLYPTSNPTELRQVGVDLNLQERLDEMFKEEHDKISAKKIDIGFPIPKPSNYFIYFVKIVQKFP